LEDERRAGSTDILLMGVNIMINCLDRQKSQVPFHMARLCWTLVLSAVLGTLHAQSGDSVRCAFINRLSKAYLENFVDLAQTDWKPEFASQAFYQIRTDGRFVPIAQYRLLDGVGQEKADALFASWMNTMEKCTADSIAGFIPDGYTALLLEPGDVVVTFRPAQPKLGYASIRYALRRTQVQQKPARYHVSISCYRVVLPEKRKRSSP
jgi:hypothetical protein